MADPTTAPKRAAELKETRLHFLEDIAKELEGEVVFPVCFDVSVRISTVMRSATASMQKIALEVQKDPLISAKLLKMANSVAFNRSGNPCKDVATALTRLGVQTARSVALACAMEQVRRADGVSPFDDFFEMMWIHSLRTAAYARVFAQHLTRCNPDTAMLAGLVHDLGAFFLLDRAAHYQELVERPTTVEYLVAQWHDSIGESVLAALELPEEIIEAVHEHDLPRPPVEQLRTLSDVIYVANIFAGGVSEMSHLDVPMLDQPAELADPYFLQHREEAEALAAELLSLW
ncbi:HDOD domain-containing protein [Chitinilyticum piscinae]|uniref:HDOD domain-containing protein n=1 Tax=Chitinilyticum piscinae TaxID=2866724 RepID=A0A8J7G2F1_9NEIS|nr:HDOD domain-containing protein [Chitinilyticum piscinae]MBE9610730.1 HDOD domain-containing protein [Chitinilyticum piscinae]